MMERQNWEAIERAARLLATNPRLLIHTGAGMSADSGVPTYRDKNGRWRDFKAFTSKGLQPKGISRLTTYRTEPHRAWGFHEYIRRLMAQNRPHAGYDVITHWMKKRWTDSFLVTTNVDGYHARAGVPSIRMRERYGNIWELQCSVRCEDRWWLDDRAEACLLDEETMLATEYPTCPFCGAVARPRVQMAEDDQFLDKHTDWRFHENFMQTNPTVYLVIGTTLWWSWPEEVRERPTIIHINPSPQTHERYDDPIAITMKAKDALLALDGALRVLAPLE